MITSAADDQEALDSLGQRGKVTDGNEVHSPFAKALFDALLRGTDKGADSNKDGIITATELYSYLRDQIETLTENQYKRQTPGFCLLKKHDKGEFIFLLPNFDRDKLADAPPLNLENNPYQGLQSYDEKDSGLFFGRENLIKQLYERVVANKQPLTVVLGASGTGKSSLMKAGLLPRLRQKSEYQFQILDAMRPGESPLKDLVQMCLSIATTITVDELAKNELALANIIPGWSKTHPKTKLLLPVDQFEELITLCKSDEEREQFQKLILDAITKYPDKIHVVITLRLDFEAQFQNSVLKDFWNDDTRFVVSPMTQDEFRSCIEKPASEKVVYFDPPSLVDDLINEVVQMPGGLPLLSFTLSELYLKYLGDRTRDNRALTKKDYEELGRVVGSLTKRANQEYDKLVALYPTYKDTVRRVMLRMISLQGSELARPQVPKSELVYPDKEESDRVQIVIKRFSEARLIVEGSNSQGEPYVEPAHDALVLGWDKLQNWKNNEQENLALQRLLTPSAQEWKNNKQAVGFLWDDNSRILLLQQVLKSDDIWLNLWSRSGKLIKEFSHGTSVNSVSFSPNGQFIVSGGDNGTIKLWSLEGKEITTLNHGAAVNNVTFSPDSQFIASAGDDNTVKIWNVNPQSLKTFQGGSQISFSPDGQLIASVGCFDNATNCTNTMKLWRSDGTLLKTFEGVSSNKLPFSFSPDNQLIALVKDNNIIELWSRNLSKIATLSHSNPVRSFSFSPDSQVIASAIYNEDTATNMAFNGDIILWGRDGKKIKTFKGHTAKVNKITFSPDGKFIASASDDKTVKIWNRDGKNLRELQGHKDKVIDVSFSPDGKTIASISWDLTIKLWNLDGKVIKE